MTDTRLVAYAPNDSKLGFLPTPQSSEALYPLNDVGSLTFAYPLDAPLSDLLGDPMEVVTEVSTDGGATWVEPPAGRFLYLRDARDPVNLDAYAVECPGYVQRLTKGVVPFTGLNAEGQREFANASPGQILNTLMGEAQSRGALEGMTWTFTGSVDSAGVAWPTATLQTIAYSPGTHFLEILLGLAEAGLVDFRTVGRGLELYAPDTTTGMAADRTVETNRVTLRNGRDLTEAPFRRTWENLADTAYVQGDNGANLIRTNLGAVKPWGRQETFVTAAGSTTPGTLQTVADGALALTDDVRTERTYGLVFDLAQYRPFQHYGVGEYVYGQEEGQGTVPARMRVRAITLTRDDQGRSAGNVVLNDRFVEADLRQKRALDKQLAGATQGGNGGPPSGTGSDILPPGAVGALTSGSTAYVNAAGDVKATIVLSWSPVTVNQDGTPIGDLDHYDVHRRRNGDTTWTKVAEVDAVNWADDGYEPNEAWEFRVCAVDTVFNRGAFSPTKGQTTASDVTGPVAPSQPAASSSPANAAAIVVTWDGLSAVAGPMDPDLEYVEVHVSTTNNFTPTPGATATLKATLQPGPGSVTIAGLNEGTIYYVKLLGRDTSGNPGAASVQRMVVAAKRTDGAAPTIPGGWTVTLNQFAVGALEASWPAITNADPVTYDVYLSQGSAVAVFNNTTFLGSTASTRFPISRKVDGTPLLADTNYYVAVKVRDGDGTASGQGTAGPTQYRKADVATISAQWAYLGDVEAQQIRSGILDAELVLAKSLAVGDGVTERKVAMTATEGFIVTDAGGSPVMSVPTDLGADISINANILAKTLTADGLAQFNDMSVVRGRTMTLQKGTQPPSSPLIATNSYPYSILNSPPSPTLGTGQTMKAAGAFYDAGAGNILMAWREGPDYADSMNIVVETRNATTGAKISTLFTAVSAYSNGFGGIAKIGSFIYILWTDGYAGDTTAAQWKVSKYNTSGVFQSSWDVTFGGSCVLGVDGSNLLIGFVSANQIRFGTYDPTTGATVTGAVTTGLLPSNVGLPVSITKVTSDIPIGAPATRVVIATTTGIIVSQTNGTRDGNSEWPLDDIGSKDYGGLIWDSTASLWKRITGQSNVAALVTYRGDKWSGAMTRAVKATGTYYDNNSTGGFHETPQGPIYSLTHRKRASITVSIDALPAPSVPPTSDDANSWNLYLGTGSGTRTTQYLVGTTGSIALSQTIHAVPGSGTNPPSSTNFTNQIPAKVASADGVYYFDGNGDAKVRNLEVDNLVRPKAYRNIQTANASATSGTNERTVATLTPADDFDGTTEYEISFSYFALVQSVTTDVFNVRIYDGATQIAGFRPPSATAPGGHVRCVVTPTAGSHTFTARVVRVSGTGDGTLNASAAQPATLLAVPLAD